MKKAFTLVEMIIVLIIMGIILLMTMGFMGNQLQRLQESRVKDSLLSNYQSHFSKNLTSSKYAGEFYETLQITFATDTEKILYEYFENDAVYWTEEFTDSFKVYSILANPF